MQILNDAKKYSSNNFKATDRFGVSLFQENSDDWSIIGQPYTSSNLTAGGARITFTDPSFTPATVFGLGDKIKGIVFDGAINNNIYGYITKITSTYIDVYSHSSYGFDIGTILEIYLSRLDNPINHEINIMKFIQSSDLSCSGSMTASFAGDETYYGIQNAHCRYLGTLSSITLGGVASTTIYLPVPVVPLYSPYVVYYPIVIKNNSSEEIGKASFDGTNLVFQRLNNTNWTLGSGVATISFDISYSLTNFYI